MPSMPSVPLISARPSLAASCDRRQSGRGQRVGGRHQGAGRVPDLTLAHQRQRAVGQRREVTGAAERAVLPHHRRDAVAEQVGEQLRGRRPDAGVPGGQRGEPEQHQPTDHLALDLGAGAGGVRADQRALQLGPHVGGDVPGGQRPEAGGDAVRRGGCGGELVDDGAGPLDRGHGLGVEGHRGAVTGDRDEVGEGHRTGAQGYGGGHGSIQLPRPPPDSTGDAPASRIRDHPSGSRPMNPSVENGQFGPDGPPGDGPAVRGDARRHDRRHHQVLATQARCGVLASSGGRRRSRFRRNPATTPKPAGRP